jgi:hypothetical protein
MSVEKIRHTLDPKTATEYVVLRDKHGRELHLRLPVFSKIPPSEALEKAIAEFEQQERHLDDHIAVNKFDPKTLKKL